MARTLSPIESDFATVEEAESYDRWFRAKVRESLADPRPNIPHEEVTARLRERRERARKKLENVSGNAN